MFQSSRIRFVWIVWTTVILSVMLFLSFDPSLNQLLRAVGFKPFVIKSIASDKFGHLAAYFLCGLCFMPFSKKEKHLPILLFFIVFGGVIEIAQGMTGLRNCEAADFIANIAGASLALAVTRFQILFF